MIDQAINRFLRFKFQDAIQKKYYGRLFDYLDYILPILIKGKHTVKKEMQCVGGQSLHLYYKPTKDKKVNYVVLRYEQGPDLILLHDARFETNTVTVLYGAEDLDEKAEEGYITFDKKGKVSFDSVDDLQMFIRENQNSLLKEERTTAQVLAGDHDNFVFRVTDRYKEIGQPIQVENGNWYDLQDQLKVFGLCNTLLCGVSENKDKDVPKKFVDDMDKISKVMEKLEQSLTKALA